jgi:hypothetical protein
MKPEKIDYSCQISTPREEVSSTTPGDVIPASSRQLAASKYIALHKHLIGARSGARGFAMGWCPSQYPLSVGEADVARVWPA